jgi:membrane-associated protease RseP (regulator of RpoE activity)
VIVSFDGTAVHGPMALSERIHDASPKDKVQVGVLRDGKRKNIDVTLGERSHTIMVPGYRGEMFQVPLPDTEALEEHLKGLENLYVGPQNGGKAWVFSRWGGRPKLGVQLVPTTPELREHLGGSRDRGVLIGKVFSGKPAEKGGIKVGDLLVSVNGTDVSEAGELIEALEDQDGKTVTLEVVRDGKTTRMEVAIPEAEDDDDESSGPRASLDDLHNLNERVRRSVVDAQLAAERTARTAQREALRQSRQAQREAMRDVRQQLRRELTRGRGYAVI